jgi:hypothetical protein
MRRRIGHRISQFDDQSFRVVKRSPVIAENGAQLFVASACFSAHGRIDVYSEGITDPRRGADFSQLHMTQ